MSNFIFYIYAAAICMPVMSIYTNALFFIFYKQAKAWMN